VHEGERLQPLVAVARHVSALVLWVKFLALISYRSQRWSGEALQLITDNSGLIVDLARIVQGFLFVKLRLCH
jgi:uncharacterized membrane protein (DUF485 family)